MLFKNLKFFALAACAASAIACSGESDDGSGSGSSKYAPDVTFSDAGRFLPPQPNSTLCNPCNSSLQCGAGSCVAYGEGGSFCGDTCAADSDCTEGYSCADVNSAEGESVKACVKTKGKDDSGKYGTCACSEWASAKSLSTYCQADNGCTGVRICRSSGLSACEPTGDSGAEEVCDGVDNNCDGQVDENTCDDEVECRKGVCNAATGCAYLPSPGSCDDGSACTKDDKCFNGGCAGNPVSCDDSNPCTNDTCDSAKGCVNAPSADGTKCDDGSPCTIGDSCSAGACKPGKSKVEVPVAEGGCKDDSACTLDLCQKTSGACINSVEEGLSCDDGDACTEGDKCDKSGNCQKGAPKTCSDGKGCTEDSCDKDKGCVFLPSATTPCGT